MNYRHHDDPFRFPSPQIGSLKGYYLFHHRHVSKRSLDSSPVHHEALNSEDEVRKINCPSSLHAIELPQRVEDTI